MMLNPIELYHSPSPKPSAHSSNSPALDTSGSSAPDSPSEKPKRVSRACDVCRNNHRKCPGPQPGSSDCQRCLKQCKTCTWSDFAGRSPRLASASVSPQPARRRASASSPQKPDRRRQASVSMSPKPSRPRKIKIRRSASVPSTPIAPAPGPVRTPASHKSPLINSPSGSPASSLTSDGKSSGPCTPTLPQRAAIPHQPPSSGPSTQADTAGKIDADKRPPPSKSYAYVKDAPMQPCEADKLPQWYEDCLAVANKHDLLLFPVPLSSWEDRQLHGKTSKLDTGLQFVVPSYVDAPATKKEVLDLLDILLVEERTLPNAGAAPQATGSKSIWSPRDEAADISSDDEPHRPAASSDESNDAPSSITPPSSPPPMVCTPAQPSNQTTPPSPPPFQGSPPIVQSVEIIVDDDDDDGDENMSEPEPDFSCDFFPDAPNPSQDLNVSPYRHKAGRDRFEAFLLSPCQCHLSPAPRFGASLARSIDVPFEEEKAKSEEAFWDEGMPDVLAEASHEMALDECLHLEQVSMFD